MQANDIITVCEIVGAMCFYVLMHIYYRATEHPDLLDSKWCAVLNSVVGWLVWVKSKNIPGLWKWPFTIEKPPEKEETDVITKNNIGKIAVILAVILTAMNNCGLSAAQKLAAVDNAADALHKTIIPVWNAECEKRADKCVADGITKKSDCKALIACQTPRNAAYDLLISVHMTTAIGVLSLAVNPKMDVSSILVKCQKYAKDFEALAKDAGWLK